MQTIYVVTMGCYSDHRVRAVFPSREEGLCPRFSWDRAAAKSFR